jgi:hypothetical protein
VTASNDGGNFDRSSIATAMSVRTCDLTSATKEPVVQSREGEPVFMIEQMKQRRLELVRELRAVDAYLEAVGVGSHGKNTSAVKKWTAFNKAVTKPHPNAGRKVSEATKAKIRAAQKARWAKLRKEK